MSVTLLEHPPAFVFVNHLENLSWMEFTHRIQPSAHAHPIVGGDAESMSTEMDREIRQIIFL